MTWLPRLAFVAGLLLGGAACNDCASIATDPDAIPNVRLGMAPRDVRERFQPAGEGSWQNVVGAGDDLVLEWTSRSASAPMLHARFEFHLGMLVAIRARAAQSRTSEEVSLTPKTVTMRAPDREGGTVVTVIARDCPTHKDEAESIAAKAAPHPRP